LARVLALYLALVLVLQAVAAANALARGPLHRHDAEAAPATAAVSTHVHAHADGQRHVHAAGQAGVQPLPDTEPALDDAAFAITAALALLAFAASRTGPGTARHVLNATPGRRPVGRSTAPPDRPPRFR
jgi:hypothetical protein